MNLFNHVDVLAFVLPSEVIKIVRKILIVNKTIHGSSIAGTGANIIFTSQT